MARPTKKGLAYFPKDVDFYQDEKIVDLGMKYGPLGLTVFDVLLTLVYREGYYLELPLRKVGQMIVRTVGESWFRKTGMSAVDLSVEVILYCAEIGLINAPLVRQNVITSVGIQTRYAAVTARNKVNLTNYWLLDKRTVDEVLESAPKKRVSATETRVSVTKTPVSDAKMPQRKENKIKENILDDDSGVSAAKTPVSVTETPELSTVSTESTVSTRTDDDNDDERVGMIMREFGRLLPKLPKPTLSARLKKNLAQSERSPEEYSIVFDRAARSSFLSSASWCTIEWMTTPENVDKVLSGRYDDFEKKTGSPKTQSQGTFDTSEIMKAIYERQVGYGGNE